MDYISFIYNLIGWERSLEYKEERRKNHRYDPYVNYLAAPQAHRNGFKQKSRLEFDESPKSSSYLPFFR